MKYFAIIAVVLVLLYLYYTSTKTTPALPKKGSGANSGVTADGSLTDNDSVDPSGNLVSAAQPTNTPRNVPQVCVVPIAGTATGGTTPTKTSVSLPYQQSVYVNPGMYSGVLMPQKNVIGKPVTA